MPFSQGAYVDGHVRQGTIEGVVLQAYQSFEALETKTGFAAHPHGFERLDVGWIVEDFQPAFTVLQFGLIENTQFLNLLGERRYGAVGPYLEGGGQGLQVEVTPQKAGIENPGQQSRQPHDLAVALHIQGSHHRCSEWFAVE